VLFKSLLSHIEEAHNAPRQRWDSKEVLLQQQLTLKEDIMFVTLSFVLYVCVSLFLRVCFQYL